MWQDYAISIIQIALSVALVPALFSEAKPDRLTCFLNAVLLSALAGVMATLGMWFTTATGSLVAVCWYTLLIQSRVPDDRPFTASMDC